MLIEAGGRYVMEIIQLINDLELTINKIIVKLWVSLFFWQGIPLIQAVATTRDEKFSIIIYVL